MNFAFQHVGHEMAVLISLNPLKAYCAAFFGSALLLGAAFAWVHRMTAFPAPGGRGRVPAGAAPPGGKGHPALAGRLSAKNRPT